MRNSRITILLGQSWYFGVLALEPKYQKFDEFVFGKKWKFVNGDFAWSK